MIASPTESHKEVHRQPSPTFRQCLRDIKFYLVLSNIIFTVVPIAASYLLPRYLYESATVLPLSSPMSYAISYDGLIFLENNYEWEINFAFLPGFTLLVRAVKFVTSIITNNCTQVTILLMVLLNKLLTMFAAANLYQLAWIYGGRSLALAASVLFLFNPASVFYHSVYSEPLFACLTIVAIKYVLQNRIKSNRCLDQPIQFIGCNWFALVLFALSITVRSTGLFLSLILGLPILSNLFVSLFTSIKRAIMTAVTGFLTLSIFVAPFIAYLVYGYYQFCNDTEHPSQFCNNFPPNIYAYVEDKFWQVGFLKYYYTGQPFQVVFGLLTVVVALSTLFVAITSKRNLLNDLYSIGLTVALVIVAVVTTLFANVQSGTRFFSTHPLFYITCGTCLLRTCKQPRFNIYQKLLICYFTLFTVAGCLWFPLRFNWA